MTLPEPTVESLLGLAPIPLDSWVRVRLSGECPGYSDDPEEHPDLYTPHPPEQDGMVGRVAIYWRTWKPMARHQYGVTFIVDGEYRAAHFARWELDPA